MDGSYGGGAAAMVQVKVLLALALHRYLLSRLVSSKQ